MATAGQDPTFHGRRIHFIGIGGSGMSGLARLVADRGGICTGTDASENPAIESLRTTGIRIETGDAAVSLPEACELVVASAAIPPEHPSRVAATDRGLEILSYAEAVGRAMIGRTAVSIAGTHGKSTTTSMLAHVLVSCGLDPSFIADGAEASDG